MHEQEQQTIQRNCEALSHAFARAMDFRDHEALAALFTEDGELDLGDPLAGRELIRAEINRRPDELRSRHVLSNHFIEVLDATNARGIAYVTIYRHIGPASLLAKPAPLAGPAAVGHFEDRFRLDAGIWRFQKRRLHLAFVDPAQWPGA